MVIAFSTAFGQRRLKKTDCAQRLKNIIQWALNKIPTLIREGLLFLPKEFEQVTTQTFYTCRLYTAGRRVKNYI